MRDVHRAVHRAKMATRGARLAQSPVFPCLALGAAALLVNRKLPFSVFMSLVTGREPHFFARVRNHIGKGVTPDVNSLGKTRSLRA